MEQNMKTRISFVSNSSSCSFMVMTNAKSLKEFKDNIKLNKDIIREAIENENVFVEDKEYKSRENNIKNKSFCITGTLSKERKIVENIIKQHGGTYQSSISKTTDFLIVGDKVGNEKINSAAKFGTRVINLEKFME